MLWKTRKNAVDADIDARGLEERGVVGVDLDSALGEAAGDRRVGEDHARRSYGGICIRCPSWQASLRTNTTPSAGAGASARFGSGGRSRSASARSRGRRSRSRERRSARPPSSGSSASSPGRRRRSDRARSRSTARRSPAGPRPAAEGDPRRARHGPLMSLPGKFAAVPRSAIPGLNTVEVDVKDETGNVAFVRDASALAIARPAPRGALLQREAPPFRLAQSRGIYLIGRVVTFEDPITSERGPTWRSTRLTARVWHTSGGLGWRTRTTGASGATTSTSRSPPRRRASTRSSSTTSASRATATSR